MFRQVIGGFCAHAIQEMAELLGYPIRKKNVLLDAQVAS